MSDPWILLPENPCEVTGYVRNVVFTCGAVAAPDGAVKICWGAADTVMWVGKANAADLVALCEEHGRPAKDSMRVISYQSEVTPVRVYGDSAGCICERRVAHSFGGRDVEENFLLTYIGCASQGLRSAGRGLITALIMG